jgi:hypothetical protein
MNNDEDMPLGNQPAMTFEVSEDCRSVKACLPPIRLVHLAEPLDIYFILDAAGVDDLLRRLSEARARMLPPPMRN